MRCSSIKLKKILFPYIDRGLGANIGCILSARGNPKLRERERGGEGGGVG